MNWIVSLVLLSAVRAAETTCPPGMVLLPGGEAVIGLSAEETEALARETHTHPTVLAAPARTVRIEPFYLDRYEVTNAQYEAYVMDTGAPPPIYWGGSKCPDDMRDIPVSAITSDTALAFAKWAGKRLPTEEEWEWACRGAERRMYPWGNDWREGANVWDAGFRGPVPVGSMPADATPEGVHDLAGNVSEFTASRYQGGQDRWETTVIRGGNWLTTVPIAAAGFSRNYSNYRPNANAYVGFRCALDASAPAPRELPEPGRHEAKANPLFASFAEPLPPAPPGPVQVLVESSPFRHGILIHATGLTRAPHTLQFPEAIHYAGGVVIGSRPETMAENWVNEGRTQAGSRMSSKAQALGCESFAAVDGNRVDLRMVLTNSGDEPRRDIRLNCCLCVNNTSDISMLDPDHDRVFVLTRDGARALRELPRHSTNRPQYRIIPASDDGAIAGAIAFTSRDRRSTYVKIFEDALEVHSNAEYSCIHSIPRIELLEPGATRTLRGALYFLPMGPEEALKHAIDDFAARISEDE